MLEIIKKKFAAAFRVFRKYLVVFREYLFFRGLKHMDLILGAAAAALLLFCWLYAMPISEVFTSTQDILLGYNAKQDAQGLYYVIDDGHCRFLCFDQDAKIHYELIDPTVGESGELYIDDFAVDDDLVYLSASEWDGLLLSREVIAAFKDGRYARTITERDYSDMTVNKHRFYGLSVRDGVLSYAECEDNAIILHRITLPDGEEHTQRIYSEDAFNAVSDCVFYQDAVYVMKKNGTISVLEDGKRALVYSTRWKGEENRIPYRMAISADGAVCFTDIRAEQAVKINSVTRESTALTEQTVSQTVNFTWDGEGALYLEEDGLRVVRGAEEQKFLTLSKPSGQFVMQKVWFAALVVLTLVAAVLLFRVIACFLTRKYTVPQLVSFWVIGAVGVVSVLLCGMLISNFSGIYRQRLMDQMENSAYIVANQIPSGTISQINRAEDFDGEAYQTLCDLMDRVFPRNLDINRQLYCNILRLSDDGENAFAIAYLDQSIGTYFPLNEEETEEVRQIYADNNGNAVWNASILDVSGTFLSVKAPIYAGGSVNGIVVVGTDLYSLESMITRLQVQIFLSIVIIIILIWLVTSEVMAWFTNIGLYKSGLAEGDKEVLPGHLIRLLIFAVFACYNMTTTFLPVWILRNSDLFAETSRDFMASLPITVNIFVIGVMSLFTAEGVRRLGIKRVLTLSTACSLCGNLLMFLLPSYFTIFFGLLIDGIGVGLITNATYVILTYLRDETNRQWGFTVYNAAYLSGINFGMLLGSLMAVVFGQRNVFLIVAIIWLLLMLLGHLLLRQLEGLITAETREENTQEETGISTREFLLNRPVMSFIVLIQNPYIVFNSFVFYFVPLFCGNNGYDETIVSILIMVYSEVAVLTGDLLTRRVTQLLGGKGIYAAYVTNIAALMVFACTRNMLGIVLALLMMGTAAAYGKPLQQTWFLKQEQVRRYGEDRAMGVYNFSENIGESLGPIVFARLMAQRPLLGAVSQFCGVILALGGGHFALNRREFQEK